MDFSSFDGGEDGEYGGVSLMEVSNLFECRAIVVYGANPIYLKSKWNQSFMGIVSHVYMIDIILPPSFAICKLYIYFTPYVLLKIQHL